MINPDRALDYLDFVQERHRIWEKRQAGQPGPWTEDPILASRKFTSVFRVLDPGTQYVLTDLCSAYDDPEDVLMRIFLYRHTGRVQAWDWLAYTGEDLPSRGNLPRVRESWQTYRANTGKPVFTGAYLVYPQSSRPGTDKVESILDLTHRLFVEGTVARDFLAARSQEDRFAVLRRNKGVADFMSMQILTDWGYTPHCGEDRENDFVVLGPGARRGAAALDPSSRPDDVLEWAYREVRDLVRLELPTGGSRPPSRMDVQNTLCEFSKYVKLIGTDPERRKPYAPAHPGPQPDPLYPKHWL